MFRQVVDAVVYLHEKGICHRDIKGENVVLDADGNCKLVDFGAAKEGGADTFLMSMQGTPAYMAPEVAQQRAHKGGPADVFGRAENFGGEMSIVFPDGNRWTKVPGGTPGRRPAELKTLNSD